MNRLICPLLAALLVASCTTTSTIANRTGLDPGAMANVAEQAVASVVNISSTKVVRRRRGPFFEDPFFRDFFRFFRAPRHRRQRSLGSGVIVSKDGLVLTNDHVVRDAERIEVHLTDGRKLLAQVVGTDTKSDLAVLRLDDAGDVKPLPLGDSTRLRLGEVVLAIGNPFGVGQTVTMGIVSAKGRANVGIVDYENFIQTDAAINPGNSGGALVNLSGELVGINTAILSRSGGYQGIGFAIPSNMARAIMDSILKHGRVVRGFLGVSLQAMTPQLARAFDVNANGVLVTDVASGSPAERAGIKRGDVITTVNGSAVRTPAQLRNIIGTSGEGARVTIEVVRKGNKKLSVTAVLEQRDGVVKSVLEGIDVAALDETTRHKYNISAEISGVVIKSVEQNSVAAARGLRPGDVILEINRRAITSVEAFDKASRAVREPIVLLVYRQGSVFYIPLTQ